MFYKCRACLCDGIKFFLTQDEPEGKELILMYLSITNFKWTTSENVGFYLCDKCEATLTMSYKFKKMCLESYEIIQQLENSSKDCNESGEDVDDCVEEIIIETESEESNDNEKLIVNNEETNTQNKIVEYVNTQVSDSQYDKKNRKQKPPNKVKEFPAEEVQDAIAMYKLRQEKISKCLVCPYILATPTALSIHMGQTHKDVWQKWCMHCNEVIDNIEEHRNLHKSILEVCPFCKKQVKKRYYMSHLKMHSDAKPYQCLLCPSGFLTNWALQVHFSTVHPLEFTDDNDEESVNDSDDPLKVSNDGNKLNFSLFRRRTQGNYCGKCDKRVKDMPTHFIRVHQKSEDKFVCHLCGKEMKSAASFKGHLKIHEGDTSFKCAHCGKLHKNKFQLKEHERIHTGEKPHICNICGRGFAQVGALGTHMKLHTGRPEECPICAKRFCRPSVLKIHLKRHSGEKPFLCTECGKAFLQKSHLMEHMKSHSDARPYVCPHCDKAFKQNSLLKSHVQIHSGYKPHKCEYCEYAAFKQYRLQQHMKLHCADYERMEKFVCPICQNGFTSQSMLKTHARSSHKAII